MRVKCFAQENHTMTQPGLEPGPLAREFSVLTTRPPRLPQYVHKRVHKRGLAIDCDQVPYLPVYKSTF